MATKLVILGRVRKGKLFLADRPKLEKYLTGFPDETQFRMVIGKHEATVSDPMRKYYFAGIVARIAEYTGETKDDVHDTMKEKFASELNEETGIRRTHSVFSNESDWSISRKREFLDDVKKWALDFLGLALPEPGEEEYE